eukprot:2265396-Prymnesium_polylepis.2
MVCLCVLHSSTTFNDSVGFPAVRGVLGKRKRNEIHAAKHASCCTHRPHPAPRPPRPGTSTTPRPVVPPCIMICVQTTGEAPCTASS